MLPNDNKKDLAGIIGKRGMVCVVIIARQHYYSYAQCQLYIPIQLYFVTKQTTFM